MGQAGEQDSQDGQYLTAKTGQQENLQRTYIFIENSRRLQFFKEKMFANENLRCFSENLLIPNLCENFRFLENFAKSKVFMKQNYAT
jgi:hypothetical protein